jgi:hypothetical protein
LEVLPVLPTPNPGDRVAVMGNSGEGKTIVMCALTLMQPDVIVVNTKPTSIYERICDKTITSDEAIFRVTEGRFNYVPSDDWARDMERKERFFKWAYNAGHRAIVLDEVNDICPSAQSYPFWFQKCVKGGRERELSIYANAQEMIRCPSFVFGQSQYRVLFHLGWGPQRKLAEEWFQQPSIPWDMIPEYSHLFLIKTPYGCFGPQPPLPKNFVDFLEKDRN